MMVDDLTRSLERGWELLSRVAPLLCLATVLWLGLNFVTKGLLIGPALVGLFAIGLRAHEGKSVDLGHAFRAFDDISVPLLAGFVFWAPFAVVCALPDAPAFLSLILLPWFAMSLPVLFVLADRPGQSPTSAARAAYDLALGESGSDGNRNALGLHVVFGSCALLCLALAAQFLSWVSSWPTVSHFLVLSVGGPAVICAMTAWLATRALPSSSESAADEKGQGDSAADGGTDAGKSEADQDDGPSESADQGERPADDEDGKGS